MIRTVMRVSWLALKRDRVAQGLAFLVPIGFFTVFAVVFGGMGGGMGGMGRTRVAVVDQDDTAASRRFLAALSREPGISLIRTDEGGTPLDRADARALIEHRHAPVAVVVLAGFADGLSAAMEPGSMVSGALLPGVLGARGQGAAVELLADMADPVVPRVMAGLVQRAALAALPVLMQQRLAHDRDLSPLERQMASRWLSLLAAGAGAAGDDAAGDGAASEHAADGGAAHGAGGLVRVETVDLLAGDVPGKSPVNAFYAAGIAVLFLLFSATATAGVLLEEERSGTLERLLASRLTMGRLLLGRWLFSVLLGMAQLTVMFAWGALVFDVALFTPRHLVGFAAMTTVTAAAAAGFGLLLATLCRTRAQLEGVGTMIILVMSAAGGSMFPRFLMPAWMQQAGLVTFNAWALDGYQKVFWYERGVQALWPQLLMLGTLAALFLGASRVLARRWETA